MISLSTFRGFRPGALPGAHGDDEGGGRWGRRPVTLTPGVLVMSCSCGRFAARWIFGFGLCEDLGLLIREPACFQVSACVAVAALAACHRRGPTSREVQLRGSAERFSGT